MLLTFKEVGLSYARCPNQGKKTHCPNQKKKNSKQEIESGKNGKPFTQYVYMT